MKLWLYKHFKWNLYEALYVARDSENNNEEFVVYKALYDHKEFWKDSIWIRPKKMFLETIERDWKVMKRFEYIWDKKYKDL